MEPQVLEGRTGELDPTVLYRILALRSAVFVVEQDCVYLDLDGRDLEPETLQLWVAGDDGEVLATLRVLTDPGGIGRIGRVATAESARGRGLAGRLMNRALELIGERESVLGAQAHLVDWYARFGYIREGEEYLEDGIPHVDMRRAIPRTAPAP